MKPLLLTLTLTAALTRPANAQGDGQLKSLMLVAEDRRGETDAEIAPLLQGLANRDPAIAAQAARAIGRLERASLAPRLFPLLKDPRVDVRVAAAHALGQLAQDTAGSRPILPVLMDAARTETDAGVQGALARSLGRYPYASAEPALAARAIILGFAGRSGSFTLLLDATRALESSTRAGPGHDGGDPGLVGRLRTLAQLTSSSADGARYALSIRRAALAALEHVGGGDHPTITAALADREPEVRRLGLLLLRDSAAVEGKQDLILRGLRDPSPMVRIEAVRVWARNYRRQDCGPLFRAFRDRSVPVSLQAIDELGGGCAEPDSAVGILWPLVDSIAGIQRGQVGTIASWHRGAHALVALARLDPNRTRGVLSRAASNYTWQVRMYAARAAGIVGDGDRLLVLAEDRDDNVREAAVDGLIKVRAGGVPLVYLAQLARSDYQLLMTTARALDGTPEKAQAVTALLATLRRISDQKRDNSRDARVALIDRVGALGTPDQADALEPYLTDFDPVLADHAAQILSRWGGRARTAAPRRITPATVAATDIEYLKGAKLRLTMSQSSGGGTIDIALYPEVAPYTVARVARLAEAGYYDGLTFHRWVANFVIQGGSPKANEYTGDGPFLRDEIGPLSHERGTLGISTRGRDTGDAQIFVNLVENLRLDFNYTVWGAVVAGLDVIDSILEGDIIERADVIRANGQ